MPQVEQLSRAEGCLRSRHYPGIGFLSFSIPEVADQLGTTCGEARELLEALKRQGRAVKDGRGALATYWAPSQPPAPQPGLRQTTDAGPVLAALGDGSWKGIEEISQAWPKASRPCHRTIQRILKELQGNSLVVRHGAARQTRYRLVDTSASHQLPPAGRSDRGEPDFRTALEQKQGEQLEQKLLLPVQAEALVAAARAQIGNRCSFVSIMQIKGHWTWESALPHVSTVSRALAALLEEGLLEARGFTRSRGFRPTEAGWRVLLAAEVPLPEPLQQGAIADLKRQHEQGTPGQGVGTSPLWGPPPSRVVQVTDLALLAVGAAAISACTGWVAMGAILEHWPAGQPVPHRRTAGRGLNALVSQGLLEAAGERRGRSYRLTQDGWGRALLPKDSAADRMPVQTSSTGMARIFGNGTITAKDKVKFNGLELQILPSLSGEAAPDLSSYIGRILQVCGFAPQPNGTLAQLALHWAAFGDADGLVGSEAWCSAVGNLGSTPEVSRDGQRVTSSLAYVSRGSRDNPASQHTSWLKIASLSYLDTFAQLQGIEAGARLVVTGPLEAYTFDNLQHLRVIAYSLTRIGSPVASSMAPVAGIAAPAAAPAEAVAGF